MRKCYKHVNKDMDPSAIYAKVAAITVVFYFFMMLLIAFCTFPTGSNVFTR